MFVVRIGASAGGLASIERFFHQVPTDCPVAFVLVQHLSPDHRSFMGEIMAKHTKLVVRPVEDGAVLERGTLYLMPPAKTLRCIEGRLWLHDRAGSQLHFPIDLFFGSLADDLGGRAMAVVLSGTGTDGTEGIRQVKQAGGIVLVQDDTAQFDGMPRSAISTGLADYILPPDLIAQKIVELASERLPATRVDPEFDPEQVDAVLQAIHTATGIEFSDYRRRTLHRRIEKRMAVRRCPDLAKYLELLAQEADEVDALSHELMIGVTSLFRDPEAFAVLRERVLPDLLVPGANVRVWVVGCSTGEEAYSLAILFDDYLRQRSIDATFRIFATDIDDRAITNAGRGTFAPSAVEQMEPRLVRRAFKVDGDALRIAARIRERIVFARHDASKDPPFTKCDLVSCRNLLIYHQRELQDRTLGMLTFALRDNGFLWLGPTESLGEMEGAYRAVDARWRVFRRTNPTAPLPVRHSDTAMSNSRRMVVERQVHRQEAAMLGLVCSALVRGHDEAAIVLSAGDNLLYLFGDTGRFITVPEGRATQSMARTIVPELTNAVGKLLRRVRREDLPILAGRAPMTVGDGDDEMVAITVHKIEPSRQSEPLFVVVFRSEPRPGRLAIRIADGDDLDGAGVREQIAELEFELAETRSHLQMTIEELESSNEELQSANEELIASNEELQSTNEELHSVNEELHTVNAEYQRKLAEQHMLTADMEHLLQTTDIGTIFLDAQYRVRRYTPAATRVVPLLPTDRGRPIGHIKHKLLDLDLEGVAESVRTADDRFERQVRSADGRAFVLRAIPYHDFGDQIDGVVMTLFDITDLEDARRELAEKELRFRQVAENIDEVIWIRAVSGEFLYLSPVAERLWGRATGDLVSNPKLWLHSVHEEDRERVRAGYERGLLKGVFLLEYRIVSADGTIRWLSDRGFPIADESGRLVRVAGVTTDVTAAKETEQELRTAARAMTQLAMRDALTGLHNRRGWEQKLKEELVRARRTGESLAALLIDCDNFKRINDEFGHNAGDHVLREIAARLTRSMRPTDVLSRIGGDEFVALLPATRTAEALRVAERMRHEVAESPVPMGSRDLEITVSLGVNTVAPGTKSTDELLGDLHHGLARSKRLGKNRVAVVRGDGVAAESAQQLSNLLQSGTAFRVVGQSIRDVRDARIIGYELLSRGPRGDLETPDAFFRLANEFDMVTEVDLHCLQQCLAASRQLLERGLRVHFNVYPSTLLAVPAENLQQRLGELPEASCLEISEQQVIGEPAYLRDRIAELRRCGLRIAIDDVGFGRSSLESLVVLEPDVIKIDRAFVTGIADEPDKRGFLKRLLSVSQGLGTEVIAEGVETEADARALGDLGVRFAQGFLWDRPAALPANETT